MSAAQVEPTLIRYSPAEWAILSENAHRVVFGGVRPSATDTISFALVTGTADQIRTFSTIIEMDKDTAYMQHGGALPGALGTTAVKRDYRRVIDYLKERYKRISTRIHHKNIPMLKLAMSEGLIINGCDIHSDGVYLNLIWGFE